MIYNLSVPPTVSIEEALTKLNNTYAVGLIVIKENNELLGTLTDGDIRRSLLDGSVLTDTIESTYNSTPVSMPINTPESELLELTKSRNIKVIPLLEDGIVKDIFQIKTEQYKNIPVVIMAGGLGSRLGEITQSCPKPMLEVAGKPVLERIIDNLIRFGFNNFFISTNYMGHVIENHFNDGTSLSCSINYLKEKKKLGTAGSLSLLNLPERTPIIITNGDLLTLANFSSLLSFHNNSGAQITMCTRKYDMKVPFGVVQIKDGVTQSIEEKPTHSFNVAAGIYVVDSSLLKHIPNDDYYDMPTFVTDLIDKHKTPVHCFPMIEEWIDIGNVSDLKYARKIYGESNDSQ